MLSLLLASVMIFDLNPQLPASIKVFDGGPRTDLNFPIVLPQVPVQILSAELVYRYNPVTIWQVENLQTNNGAMALVNDRVAPWFTWNPNFEFVPSVRDRIGSAVIQNRFWSFDLQPFDGVLDFSGPSGTTQNSFSYPLESRTQFLPRELLQLQGTGTVTVYFHPAGAQELQTNNLPSHHWGQMHTTVELAVNDVLSFIVTY